MLHGAIILVLCLEDYEKSKKGPSSERGFCPRGGDDGLDVLWSMCIKGHSVLHTMPSISQNPFVTRGILLGIATFYLRQLCKGAAKYEKPQTLGDFLMFKLYLWSQTPPNHQTKLGTIEGKEARWRHTRFWSSLLIKKINTQVARWYGIKQCPIFLTTNKSQTLE